MDRLPLDCQELIARIIVNDMQWACDTIVEAANMVLVGNGGFTELCRALQEVIEPGCKESVDKDIKKNKNKHFFLSEKSKWAHQSAKVEKRWASLMEDPDAAHLIEYSLRAKFIAERYANTGSPESLATFKEMCGRMASLKALLSKCECTLHTDSNMCRGYIDFGEGDLLAIIEQCFCYEHTGYRPEMEEWHFSEHVKEYELREWVKVHGAFSRLLPDSLRHVAIEWEDEITNDDIFM